MGKLSKLIIGGALAGITAATVYFYLDETMKESVCDADDPDAAPADNAEALKRAASRTYTMIKDGTDEAFIRVREAIGPKGNEVLDVAAETAAKVKSVLTEEPAAEEEITAEEEPVVEEKPEEAEASAEAEEPAEAEAPAEEEKPAE